MQYENTMIQTGYVTFVKKISDNSITISLGVGSKIKENEYKTGLLSARGTSEVLKNINKGDKVKVKGFLTFNFWTPEGSDKEQQRPLLVITEVMEVEKQDESNSKDASSKKTPAKKEEKEKTPAKKTTTKKEEKVVEEKLPVIDIDDEEMEVEDEEIPF